MFSTWTNLDPKKTLVRWWSNRDDPHSSARLPAAVATLEKRNMSLVIVDTPVLESPRSLAAIKAADLSIVPARPATFDIWASEVTGRRLKLMDFLEAARTGKGVTEVDSKGC